MKRLLVAVLAMTGFVFSGCIDSQDAYTLNPDGSGKVIRLVIFQPGFDMSAGFSMGNSAPEKKKTPSEEVKEVAKAEIEQSAGVEVWKDAKAYRTTNGLICFVGTAYFKDFNALKFHNGGFSMDNKPLWTKSSTGKYVLEFKEAAKDNEGDVNVVKPATPKATTPEDVNKQIAKARADHKEGMEMMREGLSSMKMYMSFRLPGKVETSRNLQTTKAGNPCIYFKGEKMIAAMDALMKDDKWVEAQVRAGVDFGPQGKGPDDDVMNEKIFGAKGSIMATVSVADTTPVFDYAKEVATAKAVYPALLKQFSAAGSGGITTATKGPVGDSAPMKNMEVEEVSLKAGENFVPTVRAKGKLPCLAMSADEGKLETAVTDNGENILPEKAFSREFPFPRLDDDKTTVKQMDMQIKAPSSAAKSIKEMSGYLLYSVSQGTKTVDLGITELAAGSKGTELRAGITEVKDDKWNPGFQKMEIEVGIKSESIKAVKLLDVSGKEIVLERSNIGGFFDKATITLSVKGVFPKTGGIKLEIHDNIKQFKTPFVIKDIPLSMAEKK